MRRADEQKSRVQRKRHQLDLPVGQRRPHERHIHLTTQQRRHLVAEPDVAQLDLDVLARLVEAAEDWCGQLAGRNGPGQKPHLERARPLRRTPAHRRACRGGLSKNLSA